MTQLLEAAAFLALVIALVIIVPLYFLSVRRSRELARLRMRDAVIHKMTRAVTRGSDMDQILKEILTAVHEIFGADTALVAIMEGDEFEGLGAGIIQTELRGFRMAAEESPLILDTIRRMETIKSDSTFSNDAVSEEFDLTGAVGIPLMRGDECFGALVLGYSKKTLSHTDDDLTLMKLLGDEAAMAISRARLIERLAKLDREKDEFVSMVSHELRGPLTAGKGFVELLIDGISGELTAKQSEYLEVAKRNLERVLILIEDLQTISQAESGRLELLDSMENYEEVVAGAIQTLTPVVNEREIQLVTEIEADLPMFEMDRIRIEQVLANLLSNAVKFTPAGGRIELRVTQARDGISTEIIDTGLGIPEAEQPNVFEKFFRASNAPKSGVPGTGLGLSICKAIVEKHGGRIGFTSSLGEGSKFFFSLPLASGEDDPKVHSSEAR